MTQNSLVRALKNSFANSHKTNQKILPQNTIREKDPSPTPPVSDRLNPSSNPNPIGGGGDSPISSNSKPINHDKGSQPQVELSQVIARPEKPVSVNKAVEVEANAGGVEQKINWFVGTTPIEPVREYVHQVEVVQEPVPKPEPEPQVQEPVPKLELEPEPEVQQPETVQSQVVEESVQVESEPEPKSKREKTPKGTKPKKRIYENALWTTPDEKIRFASDLAAAVALGVGNARNNMALVTFVVHQIDLGHSHIYFEEWKAGIPIGTSERQEWEAAPSKPYPKFVEYLAEKLKDKHDSREMALNRVGKILKDKLQAGLFWRDFKRVIEGLRQDAEKAARQGLPVALPVWFIDRADISVERAGESATVLAHLAPEQIDWVNRGLPESEKLLGSTGDLSLPGAEKAQAVEEQDLTTTPDPWADDEDEDFCFNGFIDLAYLAHQAKKVAAHPNKLSLLLIDFKSAMIQATKKQRERIRQTIEPIYPELLDFL